MDNIVEQSVDVSSRMWGLLIDLSLRLLTWVATSGTRILVIVTLTWTALVLTRRLLAFLHKAFVGGEVSIERVKRADTLTGIVRTMALLFVSLASAMMVMKEVGIDIAPILATAGIGGLAVGFGAQSLVKDVISGFFILVEDQVRIGDVVEIDGRGGQVERITLRTISLRDMAGNVHVIPNGSVTVVMNMTKDYSRYVFDIGIAYREDPDEIFAVLRGIDDEMRRDPKFRDAILEPLEILGVDSFADSAVILKARIKTRPIKQWEVGREFNRRMKKRFDELGIEIPYPHLTLYAGQDKRGQAPPLRVALDSEQ